MPTKASKGVVDDAVVINAHSTQNACPARCAHRDTLSLSVERVCATLNEAAKIWCMRVEQCISAEAIKAHKQHAFAHFVFSFRRFQIESHVDTARAAMNYFTQFTQKQEEDDTCMQLSFRNKMLAFAGLFAAGLVLCFLVSSTHPRMH